MTGVPLLAILFMRLMLKRVRIYRKKHLLALRKKLTEEWFTSVDPALPGQSSQMCDQNLVVIFEILLIFLIILE